ncbi:MAG: hypothetical protein K2Q22_16195, partial [Cytophagales bacterium]|nr:hypothetical protein [Cytophagales bacterium]
YGICRQLFLSQYASLCSALISSLPICLILGSMTNQNDLLITSFAGCAIYFILCFKNEGHKKYLILFAISTAIMTGFKASAIMVYPVLGVVALFSFYEYFIQGRFKAFLLLVLFCIGTFIIITLPAGYWENWIIYGNPIGPEHMRKEHNFEGLPLGQVVYEGWKNVFRYLANFYCFDGFLNGPHWIYGANSALWKGITWIFQSVWPDIYSQEFVRLPFGTLKKISADEEKVFFGPIGFLLLIPGIGWGIFHVIRNWKQSMKAPVVGFLSVCCLVFICSQSFFGQFDPWRGRMFGTLVLFAAPLIGCGLEKFSRSKLFNSYVLLVIVFSCWAGIWSILFRYESSWVRPNYTQKTLFQMTRMEQLMRDLPDHYAPYAKFDQLVPKHATVISWLQGSYPEYVLFGEKLTRKIYTLAEARDKKISADVIIFDQVLIRPVATDVALGNGLFLRKLNL